MKDTSLSFAHSAYFISVYHFFCNFASRKMAENNQSRGGKTGKMHILVKRIANLWITPAAIRSHVALAQSLMLLLVARQEVAKKRAGASPLDPALLRSAAVRAFGWKPSVSKAALKGVIASMPHSRVKKTREYLI